MASTERTTIAFSQYRGDHQPDQPLHPNASRYSGDADQMSAEDGLTCWVDGPAGGPGPEPASKPVLSAKPDGKRLWVVTKEHVLHAVEVCDFGTKREAGATKHSNLTGGGRAFVGGEMVLLDDGKTIAITGSSGRYRLRSRDEMVAIERAFAKSGYNVWTMGYNQDTNRPHLFGSSDPEWVVP